MPNLIGQCLGPYELRSLLGEGGMASVYGAQQIMTGRVQRMVAIKVIESGLTRKPEFVARFEREAQTIMSLSHAHILKVFDYGQQENTVYLAMELLVGGSLADRMRREQLDLETIERLLTQIANALDYAHSKGIIHRDLKPQNVLLDESENAFLTDFGIVKLLNETTGLTQSGVTVGTPAYMSPEQWQGGAIDSRSDIYSLGVMLFEMLSGRAPFKGDTPYQLMHQHIFETPPALSDLCIELPASLDGVIKGSLAKNPDERFPTAKALVTAFRAAIDASTKQSFPSAASASDLQSAPAEIQVNAETTDIIQDAKPAPLGTGRVPLFAGLAVTLLMLILAGVIITTSTKPQSVTLTKILQLDTSIVALSVSAAPSSTIVVSEPPSPIAIFSDIPASNTPFMVVMLSTAGATLTSTSSATLLPTRAATLTQAPILSSNTPSPVPTSTPTASLTSTYTPTITFTPSPTMTSTLSDTPTLILTPTVTLYPFALKNAARIRSGPGVGYPVLVVMDVNSQEVNSAFIIGQGPLGYDDWYLIQWTSPDQMLNSGWVNVVSIRVAPEMTRLPIVTGTKLPPTPRPVTRTPTVQPRFDPPQNPQSQNLFAPDSPQSTGVPATSPPKYTQSLPKDTPYPTKSDPIDPGQCSGCQIP